MEIISLFAGRCLSITIIVGCIVSAQAGRITYDGWQMAVGLILGSAAWTFSDFMLRYLWRAEE